MTDLVAKAASGQYIGARSRQEDAVIVQFPQGDMPGVAVLSDGMGGHDDGDLAGRILASEMFGEMYLAAARPDRRNETPEEVFHAALERTNARLKQHIDAGYISVDTGGTLVCVTVEGRALRWMSVGDSPLYLYRDGRLQQLNQLHSMAIQLDLMVKTGAMEASVAAQHPHRHCLTSAVTGGEIPHVDCPGEALTLEPGDSIILASDGLNVLSEAEIAQILKRNAHKDSMAMTRALLDAVRTQKAPQQDNVTLVVIQLALVEFLVVVRRADRFPVGWSDPPPLSDPQPSPARRGPKDGSVTDQDMLRSETLKGLATLQQHGRLAARAGATCASLLEKLDRPVRIGLFGLPGAGKRRVLHALTGLTVADQSGWSPTLEITYGPVPATTAMMADGGRLEASGLPDPALLAQQPVFLQVTSPDKALVGRCVLLVSTEANAEDLQAALTWAAPRIDIALWCTVDWSEAERQVWHTAPDSLRNHAILFVTGKGQRGSDLAADGFETRFSSAGQSGAESFSELTTYLDRTIKDACLHDIHAAQMFLQRNGALSARPSLPAPPSQADEDTQTATIPRPASPAVAPQVPPEAIAELARLFQAVRTSAQDMLRRLYDGTAGNTDSLLMQFEQIFEALADRVTGDDALQETWPDLATQVTQAHDLALLLRIEGGAEQLGDAAHLLVQVRHDIQERLAA